MDTREARRLERERRQAVDIPMTREDTPHDDWREGLPRNEGGTGMQNRTLPDTSKPAGQGGRGWLAERGREGQDYESGKLTQSAGSAHGLYSTGWLIPVIW